jgi:hypothetical protein
MTHRTLLLSCLVVLIALTINSAKASPPGTSLDASTTFLEPPMFSSGGYATNEIAVADVNGDGKADVLVVNQDGTVGVLLGNADGSLQPAVIYYSGGATGLSVADLNGDGKPDLAVAGGSAVGVLLGKGDGTFQPAVTYGSGGQNASSIAIGDVNGDGKPDLVVGNLYVGNGNYSRGGVGLLLGNGDGTFQGPVSFDSGGGNAYGVAVGDVNADGKLDLLVANRCSDANCTSGGVAVFLGKGDGSFQSAVTYLSGGLGSDFVTVADVNGDGRLDLLVANHDSPDYYSNGTVGVLLGNGDGTFQPAASYTSGGAGPLSLAVGDVNGDSKPDLLVTNECSNRNNSNSCTGLLSVLFGRGDGSFQPPVSYSSGGVAPTSIVVADINGDGTPDALISNQCASLESGCGAGTVSVFLATTNGMFPAPINYSSGGRTPNSVAVADLNRDGKSDVVLANQCGSSDCTNGTVGILFGSGDGTFNQLLSYGSGGNQASWVSVADMNGDGRPDLLVANQCAGSGNCVNGIIGVLLQNADGSFQSAAGYASGGYYANSLSVADVNSDGKPDLVVANQCATNVNCANGMVGVLFGNGDGTFQPAVNYSSGGMFAFSVAIADVNGDGKPDLLITNEYESAANQLNGTVGVLLGNGDGTFRPALTYRSGGRYAYTAALADVNGDGKLDLLVTNQCPIGNSCVNGELGVLLGNGDGTFQTALINPIPQLTGVQQLAVADFDGNGTLDIASGAGDFLLLGKGDGTFQPSLILGADGPGIAVGDFNLDGKPDLAVGGVTILMNISSAPARTATTTTLTSLLNPSAYGQSVSFRATVSSQSGASPTGTATFSDGGSTLGTVSLVNGSASLSVSTFAIGSHSISASYSGDSSFSQSSSSLTQTVNPAATTTAATVAPNPSVFGQSVAITTTVTSGAGVPSGSVTFNDGGTELAIGSLNGSGQAALSTSALTAGSHTIAASYSGAGNFAGSTSNAVSLTVNKASTTTIISTQTPNPSVAGQPVSISFTVNPVSPGSGARTGNVTVSDGSGDSCSAAVAAGACSIAIPAAGTKTLKATYAGDNNFNSSASAGVTHNVIDFSIISSPTSQTLKAPQKATYKLTLALLNGFAGTVSFSCAGLPANSTCSFNPASLRLGGSSSATSTVTVQTSKTTPKGTYTLPLAGIYGTGSPETAGLTHSVKVTLAVQ